MPEVVQGIRVHRISEFFSVAVALPSTPQFRARVPPLSASSPARDSLFAQAVFEAERLSPGVPSQPEVRVHLSVHTA